MIKLAEITEDNWLEAASLSVKEVPKESQRSAFMKKPVLSIPGT